MLCTCESNSINDGSLSSSSVTTFEVCRKKLSRECSLVVVVADDKAVAAVGNDTPAATNR